MSEGTVRSTRVKGEFYERAKPMANHVNSHDELYSLSRFTLSRSKAMRDNAVLFHSDVCFRFYFA